MQTMEGQGMSTTSIAEMLDGLDKLVVHLTKAVLVADLGPHLQDCQHAITYIQQGLGKLPAVHRGLLLAWQQGTVRLHAVNAYNQQVQIMTQQLRSVKEALYKCIVSDGTTRPAKIAKVSEEEGRQIGDSVAGASPKALLEAMQTVKQSLRVLLPRDSIPDPGAPTAANSAEYAAADPVTRSHSLTQASAGPVPAVSGSLAPHTTNQPISHAPATIALHATATFVPESTTHSLSHATVQVVPHNAVNAGPTVAVQPYPTISPRQQSAAPLVGHTPAVLSAETTFSPHQPPAIPPVPHAIADPAGHTTAHPTDSVVSNVAALPQSSVVPGVGSYTAHTASDSGVHPTTTIPTDHSQTLNGQSHMTGLHFHNDVLAVPHTALPSAEMSLPESAVRFIPPSVGDTTIQAMAASAAPLTTQFMPSSDADSALPRHMLPVAHSAPHYIPPSVSTAASGHMSVSMPHQAPCYIPPSVTDSTTVQVSPAAPHGAPYYIAPSVPHSAAHDIPSTFANPMIQEITPANPYPAGHYIAPSVTDSNAHHIPPAEDFTTQHTSSLLERSARHYIAPSVADSTAQYIAAPAPQPAPQYLAPCVSTSVTQHFASDGAGSTVQHIPPASTTSATQLNPARAEDTIPHHIFPPVSTSSVQHITAAPAAAPSIHNIPSSLPYSAYHHSAHPTAADLPPQGTPPAIHTLTEHSAAAPSHATVQYNPPAFNHSTTAAASSIPQYSSPALAIPSAEQIPTTAAYSSLQHVPSADTDASHYWSIPNSSSSMAAPAVAHPPTSTLQPTDHIAPTTAAADTHIAATPETEPNNNVTFTAPPHSHTSTSNDTHHITHSAAVPAAAPSPHTAAADPTVLSAPTPTPDTGFSQPPDIAASTYPASNLVCGAPSSSAPVPSAAHTATSPLSTTTDPTTQLTPSPPADLTIHSAPPAVLAAITHSQATDVPGPLEQSFPTSTAVPPSLSTHTPAALPSTQPSLSPAAAPTVDAVPAPGPDPSTQPAASSAVPPSLYPTPAPAPDSSTQLALLPSTTPSMHSIPSPAALPNPQHAVHAATAPPSSSSPAAATNPISHSHLNNIQQVVPNGVLAPAPSSGVPAATSGVHDRVFVEAGAPTQAADHHAVINATNFEPASLGSVNRQMAAGNSSSTQSAAVLPHDATAPGASRLAAATGAVLDSTNIVGLGNEAVAVQDTALGTTTVPGAGNESVVVQHTAPVVATIRAAADEAVQAQAEVVPAVVGSAGSEVAAVQLVPQEDLTVKAEQDAGMGQMIAAGDSAERKAAEDAAAGQMTVTENAAAGGATSAHHGTAATTTVHENPAAATDVGAAAVDVMGVADASAPGSAEMGTGTEQDVEQVAPRQRPEATTRVFVQAVASLYAGTAQQQSEAVTDITEFALQGLVPQLCECGAVAAVCQCMKLGLIPAPYILAALLAAESQENQDEFLRNDVVGIVVDGLLKGGNDGVWILLAALVYGNPGNQTAFEAAGAPAMTSAAQRTGNKLAALAALALSLNTGSLRSLRMLPYPATYLLKGSDASNGPSTSASTPGPAAAQSAPTLSQSLQQLSDQGGAQQQLCQPGLANQVQGYGLPLINSASGSLVQGPPVPTNPLSAHGAPVGQGSQLPLTTILRTVPQRRHSTGRHGQPLLHHEQLAKSSTNLVPQLGRSILHHINAAAGKQVPHPVQMQAHETAIYSCSFSSTGTPVLASGGYDHSIKLWDIGTKQCLHTFEGHTSWVTQVVFSPMNSTTLASCSSDNSVRVWNTETKTCAQVLHGHRAQVRSVSCSFHVASLIGSASYDQTIRLWDCERGVGINTLQGLKEGLHCLSFSPLNANILASGGYKKAVMLWDVRSGKSLNHLKGHTQPVTSISFSPTDENLLVSSSGDKSVRLWDSRSERCMHVMKGHSGWIWNVRFSEFDNTLLASASDDGTVRVWDSMAGTCLHVLEGHACKVLSACFAPAQYAWGSPTEGSLLATAAQDGAIWIWDFFGI